MVWVQGSRNEKTTNRRQRIEEFDKWNLKMQNKKKLKNAMEGFSRTVTAAESQ